MYSEFQEELMSSNFSGRYCASQPLHTGSILNEDSPPSRQVRKREFQACSGDDSFKTAKTSKSSFATPHSGHAKHDNGSPYSELSEYRKFMKDKGLLVDPFHERDWSGRGQHAEYAAEEANNIPLKTERTLGSTYTALVESVLCRRIRLARKTIRCRGRMRREDAITEVAHLHRLHHHHIVQVVGTYVLGRDLCILLYPVAEYDLQSFIESIVDEIFSPGDPRGRGPLNHLTKKKVENIQHFFPCLARTMRFMHRARTKHMDIKPKNILVRNMEKSKAEHNSEFKIYIADFGIARTYQTVAESETDGHTAFTPMYSAPEVHSRQTRGFSADIFSLGLVYLEMMAILTSHWNVESMPGTNIKGVEPMKPTKSKFHAEPTQPNQSTFKRSAMATKMETRLTRQTSMKSNAGWRPVHDMSGYHIIFGCCAPGSKKCCAWNLKKGPAPRIWRSTLIPILVITAIVLAAVLAQSRTRKPKIVDGSTGLWRALFRLIPVYTIFRNISASFQNESSLFRNESCIALTDLIPENI